MKRYKQVDREFLIKFFDILSHLDRSCSKYRKDKRCNREIFVRRTINKFLSGKYFEVILKEKTGLKKRIGFYDYEDIYLNRKNYLYIVSVEFGLGYSDYINITSINANSSKCIEKLKFSYNDFLDTKYKVSTEKKFKSIQNLFVDDSEK